MQHVSLGRTGLKVSRLCLGTMTFGVQADESAAHAILNKAADGGVTFIDTADVYPIGRVAPGTTEEIIGRCSATTCQLSPSSALANSVPPLVPK